MNGEVCCILGVCCPPNSAAQRDALTKEIQKTGVQPADAKLVAGWILENFDLAPAGSLKELKGAIAKLARGKSKG